jgi:transcription initiation factor TFIIIB Brf1 subunit/transcription initiation factor TFIIB
MALAQTLADMVNVTPQRVCLVGAMANTLDDPDREALEAAINHVWTAHESGLAGRRSTGLSASAIYRALRAEGYKMSEDSVTRHVYRRCACFA